MTLTNDQNIDNVQYPMYIVSLPPQSVNIIIMTGWLVFMSANILCMAMHEHGKEQIR